MCIMILVAGIYVIKTNEHIHTKHITVLTFDYAYNEHKIREIYGNFAALIPKSSHTQCHNYILFLCQHKKIKPTLV